MNVKLTLILIFCAVTTACTTTSNDFFNSGLNDGLNRSLVHKEKVSKVNVNQLSQQISIELGASNDLNASRRKAFAAVQKNLHDINLNSVLKNALHHNSVGKAFSEDVVVGSQFGGSSYLTPTIKPTVVMSSSYDVITITLTVSTTQKGTDGAQNQYNSVYSTEKTIGNHRSTSNRQFWIDNPLVLKEKLVNGLYDVAEQFADDFNGKR